MVCVARSRCIDSVMRLLLTGKLNTFSCPIFTHNVSSMKLSLTEWILIPSLFFDGKSIICLLFMELEWPNRKYSMREDSIGEDVFFLCVILYWILNKTNFKDCNGRNCWRLRWCICEIHSEVCREPQSTVEMRSQRNLTCVKHFWILWRESGGEFLLFAFIRASYIKKILLFVDEANDSWSVPHDSVGWAIFKNGAIVV